MDTVTQVLNVINLICNISNPNFTKESKQECGVFVTNCVVEFDGTMTRDQEKILVCTRDSAQILKKIKQ